MDWNHPNVLLLFVPAVLLLWWFHRRSIRPMSIRRRRALLAVRCTVIALALLALAGPALRRSTERQATILVLDHSQSLGDSGMQRVYQRASELADNLPSGTHVGVLSMGARARVLQLPATDSTIPEADLELMKNDGGQTNLASAVSLASGLFPPGASRQLVLITDGQQTQGDLEAAARDAALLDVVIDAVPVAGEQRPDVRAVRLVSSKKRRSHEGATVELRADIESSMAGEGTLSLYENGIEVESRPIKLETGQKSSETFRRTPEERNLYTYRVRIRGFPGEVIPDNNEAMTLVDVRGRPLLLYVEGEPDQAHYLAEAMENEGIRLHTRPPESFPQSLQELSGYDGIVLSDLPAHRLNEQIMASIRDYVEQLGGGFVMIGGRNSFGVGGYYRTPIEEILPVKIKAPDKEERFSTALVLVLDRSGSMRGQKVEICKSAAVATVELLSGKDFVGVVAFDSNARWVVPMTRASSKSAINLQIATINAGGGTNMHPGMVAGREALNRTQAKVKHMIVLSDGQTRGGAYQQLAAAMKGEGITISAVAIGQGSHAALMQTIAAAGGGNFYQTLDPTNIPRIFTQDAMTHVGKLIREESFQAKHVERHAMLKGCPVDQSPELLGYVKTNRKATARVPLVTDLGDPLLAHWQFGLGKVTAFTSDCKSRWGALWITQWPSYSQFWAQVLRETARKPQSQFMDIRLAEQDGEARIQVDLLEDATSFKNDAQVTAEVYYVAAGGLGSNMKRLHQLGLQQVGPGRYEGGFNPDEPGVYLTRARSGAQLVSAGLVHSTSGETATGQINDELLDRVCKITGGQLLATDATELPSITQSHGQFVDLTPLLLKLLVLLFLVDVAIRRWENILGMVSIFQRD